MIQNKTLLRLLYSITVSLDRPAVHVLNRVIQFLYLRFVIPVINLNGFAQIRPRHSIFSAADFNAAASDLDISVVIQTADSKTISKARTFLGFLKKALPFLGEIEIYTAVEEKVLERLYATEGNTYLKLRNFRKVWWMLDASKSAVSKYHHYKAHRSLRITLRKIRESCGLDNLPEVHSLGLVLQGEIEKLLPGVAGCIQVPTEVEGLKISCPYMSTTIIMGGANSSYSLVLAPHYALVLLSLTPVYYGGSGILESEINKLRRRQDVFDIWKNLTQTELLIFQAFERGLKDSEDTFKQWGANLRLTNRQVLSYELT